MNGSYRLATAAFPVFAPRSWAEVEDVIAGWVAEATRGGAQLLAFPEYAALCLTALFPPATQADLRGQLAALQDLREDWLALHRRLAREHRVDILAGSIPWRLDDGVFRNRSWLCRADGAADESDFQDKRVMTRFEREHWDIAGVDRAPVPLSVFDTAVGRIGIELCYDAEFPLHAHAQVEAGAGLILVPSCTDGLAGHHRVHVAARARALEGQCVVAVAALVGEAPWSPAIDVNVGAAAVYGPPDRGFPDDGVIALGAVNVPGWVYADIEPARIAAVRGDGQVLNWRDWGESVVAPLPPG